VHIDSVNYPKSCFLYLRSKSYSTGNSQHSHISSKNLENIIMRNIKVHSRLDTRHLPAITPFHATERKINANEAERDKGNTIFLVWISENHISFVFARFAPLRSLPFPPAARQQVCSRCALLLCELRFYRESM